MLDLAIDTVRPKYPQSSTRAPSDQRTLSALLSIAKSTRAFYGLKLAALGFHNGQDELLLAIDREGTMVSVMAEQLMIRPSTVSKMMDRLVERGLVERILDKRDARRTLVTITPAGMEVRERLIEMRESVDAELRKVLETGAPLACDDGTTHEDQLGQCAAVLTKLLRRYR